MKIASILGSSTLVAALSLSLVATSAYAQMSQSQSQKSSQSSNFSSNCSSNCSNSSMTFSSSSSLDQSQSQSGGWGNYSNTNSNTKPNYGHKKNKPTNGKLTIGWEFDEGTCYIRYTEANQNNGAYKYSKAAACSDGETTIAGLRRGTAYRFQVKQDDGEWSEPVTMKAY